ncbi:MAG: hypothetical protein A4E48_02576 [Methanosaeta sp. PtaU1.Bin060]|nr:MAG: hypothetical protein A4E48_02576 [Methanosaeta sp. PtaU1.Bin060]
MGGKVSASLKSVLDVLLTDFSSGHQMFDNLDVLYLARNEEVEIIGR